VEERCNECGRDVALGTPLFAHRVRLITAGDPDAAFVCIDCRGAAPLLDAEGRPLSEDQLAGMKYVVSRGSGSRQPN
jgi:hypothetical protein